MAVTLSIVIPVYRSEPTIHKLVEQLNNWRKTIDYEIELIFVNDFSPDNSERILTKLLEHEKLPCKCISLAKNYGQHTATAIGFMHCNGDYIATMDDDLQHSPEDIDTLLKYLIQSESDLVYGNFEIKKHHLLRNTGTRLLQWVLSKEGRNFSMVTSLRVMKKQVLQLLPKEPQRVFFLDDVLLLSSGRVNSVAVNHYKRANGKSTYSWFKLFNLALSILLLHSSFPLRLISRIGLLISSIFFCIGSYYLYKKWMYDAVLGYTSIIVSIFFSTGLILFSLGIIGEYIRRIWEHIQRLDRVVIERKWENGE